jgi:hypothetical protein
VIAEELTEFAEKAIAIAENEVIRITSWPTRCYSVSSSHGGTLSIDIKEISTATVSVNLPAAPRLVPGGFFPERAIAFNTAHHSKWKDLLVAYPELAIFAIHPDIIATGRESSAGKFTPGRNASLSTSPR